MSIMEMSHRSKEYEAVNAGAEATFKRLLGVGDGYRVVFLQGGASTQFAMVPMNFLPPGGGRGLPHDRGVGREGVRGGVGPRQGARRRLDQGRRLPPGAATRRDPLGPDAAYVHLTSNETIQGIQWRDFPDVGDRPLVGDMSSDILSRPFDAGRVRPDLRRGPEEPRPGRRDGGDPPRVVAGEGEQERADDAPLRDARQERLALQHAADVRRLRARPGAAMDREAGGLPAMAERNASKARPLYDAIDQQRRLLPRPRRAGVALADERHLPAAETRRWRSSSSPRPRRRAWSAWPGTARSAASRPRSTTPSARRPARRWRRS